MPQHEGAVRQLGLDPVENRYLLAGAADATVAVYDTCATHLEAGTTESCPAVLKIARNNSSSHKFSITSVAWYPIDSGLFATGSLDNDVKARPGSFLDADHPGACFPHVLFCAGVGYQHCPSSMHLPIWGNSLRCWHVPNCISTLPGGSCRGAASDQAM